MEEDDALHAAIDENNLEEIERLLRKGHDPDVINFDGMVPLSTLSFASGSIEIAKLLLQCGADPDGLRTPLPPLVLVGGKQQFDIMFLLLEHGADINIRDEEGYTTITQVLMAGRCDIALQLLDLGADPWPRPPRYGETVRGLAVEAGCDELVRRIDELEN